MTHKDLGLLRHLIRPPNFGLWNKMDKDLKQGSFNCRLPCLKCDVHNIRSSSHLVDLTSDQLTHPAWFLLFSAIHSFYHVNAFCWDLS
ncbi:hypothetical protein CEXT_223731 [Caerostris extrusa]|uniref:Uncharacterized protein n=1 Tax=Caerostris extrusa TaxID=172846 RepID=A0AAV4XTY4_CAEEX|nr:hypothetical protein CEXT_223731 [Caerostris extrusa]